MKLSHEESQKNELEKQLEKEKQAIEELKVTIKNKFNLKSG